MNDISVSRSIRDLSDAEFWSRYQTDRLTATVLTNKFEYLVEHMCTDLLNTAFSFILREWYDFAATVSGPRSLDYPMPAVSNSLLMFIGTMDVAVRNTFEEYGMHRLRPGDVLIANDTYRVGNHVNDLCVLRPVFASGVDEPIAFLNFRAHMLDIGGIVPAGFSGTKRNVYENGLVLAPRLLYRDEQPVKETYDLLYDNTRMAPLLQRDLTSIYQSLLSAEGHLLEAVERYGLDAYLGAMRYSCDVSAESMREAIERLPDGDYHGESTMDCDGMDDSEEYTVRATVRIRGPRAEIDLSGTSRQARTSVNGSWLDARTGVAVALKFLLDRGSRFSSGALRDVDIVLPEGTFVSARPPDGAVMLYWEATDHVLGAVFRALEPALGAASLGGAFGSLAVHNANGVRPDGTPWVATAMGGGEHGPWPGTAAGDGQAYGLPLQANNIDFATEAIEADLPIVLLRKDYLIDSGGPGKHRGGPSSIRDSLYLEPGEHNAMPLSLKRPTGFGVYGGRDGGLGGVWMWDGDAVDLAAAGRIPSTDVAEYRRATPIAGMFDPQTGAVDPAGAFHFFARKPSWPSTAGAMWRYITNGAGGWGDPFERDATAVLEDVQDGYVSVAGAERDYGVAISGDPDTDPEAITVDETRTRELRGARLAVDAVGGQGDGHR